MIKDKNLFKAQSPASLSTASRDNDEYNSDKDQSIRHHVNQDLINKLYKSSKYVVVTEGYR